MKSINTIEKVAFAILFTFTFSLSTLFAQNDMMYVMKSGIVVGKYNVNTQIDSVIFYQPQAANIFTDSRDGTVYLTVTIGDQVWMAENLAYLPSVNQVADGSENGAGSYYYVYGYDGTNVTDAKATANYSTYGVLYNYEAAKAACPAGWHLPSEEEWTLLTDYLGGTIDAAGKLKETGTIHWESPNTGAINETGFTALPGGYRYNGSFSSIGYYGIWWTLMVGNAASPRYMANNDGEFGRESGNWDFGFSVRCVRD